jgi:hypothetical protein
MTHIAIQQQPDPVNSLIHNVESIFISLSDLLLANQTFSVITARMIKRKAENRSLNQA